MSKNDPPKKPNQRETNSKNGDSVLPIMRIETDN